MGTGSVSTDQRALFNLHSMESLVTPSNILDLRAEEIQIKTRKAIAPPISSTDMPHELVTFTAPALGEPED